MPSSSCHAYTSFLVQSPRGHCCLRSECSLGGPSYSRLGTLLRIYHPDLFKVCLSSLLAFSWDLAHRPFLFCCWSNRHFGSFHLSLWQSRFPHWPYPSMEICSDGVCLRLAQYSQFYLIKGTFLKWYRSLSQITFWLKSAKESLETSLSDQSTWSSFYDWTALTSVSFGKPLPDNHPCPLLSIGAEVY